MWLSIVFLVAGIVLILWGADRLTDGASAFARRLNVSDMVIGLTVVAFGTSMPEFVISLFAAIRGSSDISIGNIVGSNVFNVLAIVGCAAVVCPINITKNTLYKDIPFSILSAIVLIAICLDAIFGEVGASNYISRGDGILLLGFFAVFMWYTFSTAKNGVEAEADEAHEKTLSIAKTWLYILLGLACLVGGGQIFVTGASDLARLFGVSESVIGLTIVAGGTSLPELATSVVAARKGRSAIAIGNVIGSFLFNIFWVLGVSSVISPMKVGDISPLDMGVMLGSIILLWLFAYSKHTVSRVEGAIMLVLFFTYMTYLVVNA